MQARSASTPTSPLTPKLLGPAPQALWLRSGLALPWLPWHYHGMILQDEIRAIIREELAPILARLDALAPGPVEPASDGRAPWAVHLEQWLAAQPPGLTGRAVAILPSFLATSPPPCGDAQPWTPQTFGRALGMIHGRVFHGRYLSRRANRKGVYIWTVSEATP